MLKILWMFCCTMGLGSCTSNDLSGVYTITDYTIESQLGTPEQNLLLTNEDRSDCLGTKLNVTQYDNSIMLTILSGRETLAKEIANVAFSKQGANTYTAIDGRVKYTVHKSGSKLIVKEVIENVTVFKGISNDTATVTFTLTKD